MPSTSQTRRIGERPQLCAQGDPLSRVVRSDDARNEDRDGERGQRSAIPPTRP